MTQFPPLPDLYAERRQKLLAAMGEGVAIINAFGVAPDPSLEDRNLQYLTGLTSKQAILVLAPEGIAIDHWSTLHGPEVGRGRQVNEVLFVDQRDERETYLDGAGRTLDEISNESGVAAVYSLEQFAPFISRALMKEAVVWLNAPTNPGLGDAAPTAEPAIYRRLRERFYWLEVRNIAPLIHDLRWVKDAYEIDCLRRAFALHAEIYKKLMQTLKPGVNESVGHALFEHEVRLQGDAFSFGLDRYEASIIVASGANTAVGHYMANNREIRDGDLVLIDSGVICNGYSSDISTTFPANGRFSSRQRELYEIVLEAQKKAIATMRPGASQFDAHKAVYDHLEAHGLAQYNYGTCGHPVGLNIHDANGEQDKPLEPGVVLVIEPFLVMPEEGIGIRIESGVLITADGHELLPDAPKEVDEIEALCTR